MLVVPGSPSKQKLGAKAPWSVGWYDPEGRNGHDVSAHGRWPRRSARQIEGQLAAGSYHGHSRQRWLDFAARLRGEDPRRTSSRGRGEVYKSALDNFERLVRPQSMAAIKTSMIDSYIAQRRTEAGP